MKRFLLSVALFVSSASASAVIICDLCPGHNICEQTVSAQNYLWSTISGPGYIVGSNTGQAVLVVCQFGPSGSGFGTTVVNTWTKASGESQTQNASACLTYT